MNPRRGLLLAATALCGALTGIGDAARATAATTTCAVPRRPALCRSFAVFRRAAQPADRLPPQIRDDPPVPVTHSSSRLVGRARGHRFYLLGGRRWVCLLEIARSGRSGGGACSRVRKALAGRMYLELPCEPRHRFIHAQPMPDGVASAVVSRVAKPARRFAISNNLLLADLHLPSDDYLPTRVAWRRDGRLHRLGLGWNAGDDPCSDA